MQIFDEFDEDEIALVGVTEQDTSEFESLYRGEVCYSQNDETEVAAAIQKETESAFSLSWQDLADATFQDKVLSRFLTAISDGTLESLPTNDDDISQLLRYRDFLYISSGVIMYGDRVVVPSSLRRSVLDILHSAHQGVSGMDA